MEAGRFLRFIRKRNKASIALLLFVLLFILATTIHHQFPEIANTVVWTFELTSSTLTILAINFIVFLVFAFIFTGGLYLLRITSRSRLSARPLEGETAVTHSSSDSKVDSLGLFPLLLILGSLTFGGAILNRPQGMPMVAGAIQMLSDAATPAILVLLGAFVVFTIIAGLRCILIRSCPRAEVDEEREIAIARGIVRKPASEPRQDADYGEKAGLSSNDLSASEMMVDPKLGGAEVG